MRVLFAGSGWRSFVDIIARAMPPGTEVSLWDRTISLERAIADIDVLLPSNAPIGPSVIGAGRKLKLIQQPAAGVENIDLAASRAAGIPVCNAPGANPIAVAELSLFLMLALARRLPEARAAFSEPRIGEPVGRELRGRRLGVVGTGRSGTLIASMAQAIGMTVSSVNSRRSEEAWHELLRDSDIITLHCPLTDATRNLIDERAFALMKPGALLINCSRGAVVDRAALERALDSGHLGGAGLDVFWEEPWNPADPLYHRPNVVVTPH